MVKNGTLNSNNRLVVENGKRVSFKVIAIDEDNDTVTFELVGNVTSVSIDQTGNITYLPDVTKPVTIRYFFSCSWLADKILLTNKDTLQSVKKARESKQ